MSDEGKKAKDAERYERAAHRVQTAIAFNPDRPRDQYKDLRTGIDMSKADAAGLATLLIAKGVFTLEEYIAAVADSAEREADQKEDELSVRHGINVRTV
ncbi:MAG: hypothetical protein LCH61_12050 [Proteobacteria bacterium]|nr:hypothetical protein [Pseudomonadota bacterium]